MNQYFLEHTHYTYGYPFQFPTDIDDPLFSTEITKEDRLNALGLTLLGFGFVLGINGIIILLAYLASIFFS